MKLRGLILSRRNQSFIAGAILLVFTSNATCGLAQTGDTDNNHSNISASACPIAGSSKGDSTTEADKYIQAVIATIQKSWTSQPATNVAMSPLKAWMLVVRFKMHGDGTIDEPQFLRNSGDKLIDQAAVAAILRSAPFSSLPSLLQVNCLEFPIQFTSTPGKEVSLARGGVYRVGGGVSAPKPIFTPDPEYSKEAREAKYEGVCILSLIVGPDGNPRDIHVAQALGKGLDEKAIDAVKTWRFEPAMKDGKPVAVAINIEVRFRLR